SPDSFTKRKTGFKWYWGISSNCHLKPVPIFPCLSGSTRKVLNNPDFGLSSFLPLRFYPLLKSVPLEWGNTFYIPKKEMPRHISRCVFVLAGDKNRFPIWQFHNPIFVNQKSETLPYQTPAYARTE